MALWQRLLGVLDDTGSGLDPFGRPTAGRTPPHVSHASAPGPAIWPSTGGLDVDDLRARLLALDPSEESPKTRQNCGRAGCLGGLSKSPAKLVAAAKDRRARWAHRQAPPAAPSASPAGSATRRGFVLRQPTSSCGRRVHHVVGSVPRAAILRQAPALISLPGS